ncbi:phosphatidylserine decarboxylase [Fulvivirga lutea]|uniref:Phosphatidylserine decarboxylase n=1 Tax=Fulvivirga lutea TaxID=2810512 RepID=A0A974WFY8_9BACT|nr:phosphatidylserine decarboxylase [Fulvivirga lutea]QSE96412.1 phosphatidylserine decarboxylase [Fulvivirga lutea]
MTSVYRFLSLSVWGSLPSNIQRKVSKYYSQVYNKSFTKYIIKPYCRLNRLDEVYLNQFRSETGSVNYSSFQDFFTRVYKTRPKISSEYIWPCEGLLCDKGKVGELPAINVKGDKKNIKAIFGKQGCNIPNTHYFTNVFLHNNNYHRIHAPVSGTVKYIEHIPGDLVILRPWVYKHDPSLPAMRNERVNVTIEDISGRYWYLSIVGGPAVGTIELPQVVRKGNSITIGDEVGKFLLGSTLCMASPQPTDTPNNSQVVVAQKY